MPSVASRLSTDGKTRLPSLSDSSISQDILVAHQDDTEAQEQASPGQNPVLDPVPDGGFEAWLHVLGSWVVSVNTWGIISSFGPWLTYYHKGLLIEVSASDLSWIGSLQAALLLFVGPIAGPLYDAGYLKQLLWAGLFLILFGLFMASLCTTYWQLIVAQGVCVGIGCGLTFLPSTASLSQYFCRRRSLAIGLASTGSPIAGMVIPIILGKLIPKIGLPWATRVVAFVLMALSIIPLSTMRIRIPQSSQKRSLIDKRALRDVPFLLCSLGTATSFLTLYIAYFYIQLFAIEFDIASLGFSNYFVTILSAGSIVGRVSLNYAADKVGPLNMLALVTFISGILSLAWLGIRGIGELAAFALLYGCFSGGLMSISLSVVASLTPDLSLLGTRMGMASVALSFAMLCGPPVGGAILKSNTEKAWLATIGYSAAALLLGSFALFASRVTLYRKYRMLRA